MDRLGIECAESEISNIVMGILSITCIPQTPALQAVDAAVRHVQHEKLVRTVRSQMMPEIQQRLQEWELWTTSRLCPKS